jgi:hypothetical protein
MFFQLALNRREDRVGNCQTAHLQKIFAMSFDIDFSGVFRDIRYPL